MKFGFGVFPFDMFGHPKEIARVVRRADALGFDYVTFPEHVIPSPAVNAELANQTWPDFTTLAAYLAAQTERIEIVAGVYILPLCNPIRLARQLLTLDQLSDGRVIFGIGVGWNPQEFEAMGIPFAERASITDEYAAALKVLWSQEPASFAGKHVRFDEVSCLPKPARGTIRLLAGGAAARGPLERIVKTCDGWMPWKVTRQDLPAAMTRLSGMLEKAGRRLDQIDVTWGVSLGSNAAMEQARRHATTGEGEDEGRLSRPVLDEIRELEALGITMASVSFAWESPDGLIAALERFAADVLAPYRESARA